MFSCICWACFMRPASCPFISASSLYRFDRRLVHARVEVFDEVAYELVLLDFGDRIRLFPLPLAIRDVCRRVATALSHSDRDLHAGAIALLKRGLEPLLITL